MHDPVECQMHLKQQKSTSLEVPEKRLFSIICHTKEAEQLTLWEKTVLKDSPVLRGESVDLNLDSLTFFSSGY